MECLKIMGRVTKSNLSISAPVLVEALSVLEEWALVQEGWKQLEYIMTGEDLVIGMAGSLIGNDILLDDLHEKKHLVSVH